MHRMLYAILCYDNEAVTSSWSKEKDAEVMENLGAVLKKLDAQGRMGPTARLLPTSAATTIRKGKDPVIMDGPFAETKEQLLGFYVIECASLDEALATAKDLAQASGSAGAFEIRPLGYFNAYGLKAR
jgi:hypothetical protein